jgi:MtrB/PioB family decaheme-associated outer membrane protein
MSKLSVGYEYEQRDRDFSEVESTDEHTFNIKLWTSINPMLNGWIKYAHSERDGSGYVSNQPFLDAHNPDYIATLAANDLYINDPLLRKYTYADRDRDQITGTINIIPSNPLMLSITAKYASNDYEDSILGLQQSDDYSLTLDGSYIVSKDLSAYAFVTHEAMEYQQAGYQRFATELFPGIVRDPPPCFTCGFWNVGTDDETNTFGAGFDWTITENKLDVKLDYTYSDSVTEFAFTGDSNIGFAALPDVESSLHSINLTGNYQLNDKTTLRLHYLYERLNIDDFALDNVNVDTLSNVINPGNANPNYNAHVIGLSFVYDF